MKSFFFFFLSLAFILTGCGGGSSSGSPTSQGNTTPNSVPQLVTAQVIDAPVKGLSYKCGDKEGVTNENGEFTCYDNVEVSFSIGNMSLGAVSKIPTDKKVFPQEILGKTRDKVEDSEVLELARLLQSLDDDGDTTSHINITDVTRLKFATKETFIQTNKEALVDKLVDMGKPIINISEAKEHLVQNVKKYDNTFLDSNLQKALLSGDASYVTESELQNELIKQLEDRKNYVKAVFDYIYVDGMVSTTFPERSAYFKSFYDKNYPIHINFNSDKKQMTVSSWLGEDENGTRYGVFGTNVFINLADAQVNMKMKNSTLRVISWILDQPLDSDILTKPLKFAVQSNYTKSDIESFLTSNGLTSKWSVVVADKTMVENGNYDIYVSDLGYDSKSDSRIAKAMSLKKPVITFNRWYEVSDENLAPFGLKWDWYNSGTVDNFSSIEPLLAIIFPEMATVKNLKDNTLNFDYTATSCPTSVGKTTCDNTLTINKNDNTTLGQSFMYGATNLKTQLASFDEKGENLFGTTHTNEILKLAILLGDKYRENIKYPMNKSTTNQQTFYKALFADHVINYSRPNNPLQPDLGDFDLQPTHNGEALVSQEKSFLPTNYDEWTSSGFYALPSKTMTITRTDTSNNEVFLKFNILRADSTRLWGTNQYSRPRFLQSNQIKIEKGKSYKLSTPHGGGIYVYSKAVESDAVAFSLKFENVAQHPFLEAFDEASINAFSSKLDTSTINWVDIKTPFVEIHSLTSKIKEALSSYPTVKAYLDDVKMYLIDNNLNLAGFVGDGLFLNSSVASFCDEKTLDCTNALIHKKPKVQHINSDHKAACGSGCSGNPFDVSWAVEARGWGDNHEFGHNLQVKRMKIYDGKSTEVSNNIHPLYTNWKYLSNNNIESHILIEKRPPHQEAYKILQDAIKLSTSATEAHPMWSEGGTYDKAGERLSFYMQLVYAHENWDIYTKLYLMNRIFEDGIKTDAKWTAVKSKLGFGTYNLTEANAINGNDFMCVALSYMSGKSHVDYFTAWGILVSDKAKAQIQSYGLSNAPMPVVFYAVPNNILTKTLRMTTKPLDGTSSY